MANDDAVNSGHWCFAWYEAPPATTSEAKAALVKANQWPKGSTIRIGFMDGTSAQQALVKKFAEGWIASGLGNLNFSWSPVNTADIRISFAYSGSWSVIGTSCKNVPKNQPTMNFGWLSPGVTDTEAQRVILHEFGHALGLIHEHQNPLGSIAWNKPAVYHDLSGPPNNWNKATIDHNMFEAYPPNEIDGTKIDKTSIMMYPIPASWVTDPNQAVGLNSQLSAVDKTFIKKAYP
jgi:serralysin